MKSQARFTFCIPNLNKIKFLPACIESILAQDCDDWVCVFVDGFSTDGCWEYMQQFADDSRFRLLRGLKNGMYPDWNYCLEQVETEYFYILTSDDTCYPQLVSKTTQTLDQNLDVDVCHFQYALIDSEENIIHTPKDFVDSRFPIYSEVNEYAHRRSGLCESIMHFVYGTIYMSITSLVFRSRILDKMIGFSSDYGPVGDYDWSMRIGLYSDVIYIPELLATWRLYPEQATAKSDGLQAAVDYMKIVSKNVELLKKMVSHKSEWNELNERQLTSKILDVYIHAHLEAAFSKHDFYDQLKNLRIALFSDLSYFPRKAKRRLNKTPYKQSLTIFAHKLIKKHSLIWPPSPLNSSKIPLDSVR
jgi:glycosyltransferase involved in cell wall biosynthesis